MVDKCARRKVSLVGYRQVPFFYDREKRFAGETQYPFFRLLALALDGIAASSTKPLMLASYAGALFAFLCLGFIGYAIYSLLFVGQTPQGWTSLVIVVTLMGERATFRAGDHRAIPWQNSRTGEGKAHFYHSRYCAWSVAFVI